MKVGDCVICTFGSNKDKKFIIKALLKDKDSWYSCQLEDGSDSRYYQFHERHLQITR